jgi:quinol monooxygenase YgiN
VLSVCIRKALAVLKEKPLTTISKNNKVVTLINVFTVDPKDQQRLADMLWEATEKTMKKLPGFVSANIHKSLDGVRVANYAQWRSREDFEAMLKNPEATAHMKPIADLAKFDAHLYEVSETTSQ